MTSVKGINRRQVSRSHNALSSSENSLLKNVSCVENETWENHEATEVGLFHPSPIPDPASFEMIYSRILNTVRSQESSRQRAEEHG